MKYNKKFNFYYINLYLIVFYIILFSLFFFKVINGKKMLQDELFSISKNLEKGIKELFMAKE